MPFNARVKHPQTSTVTKLISKDTSVTANPACEKAAFEIAAAGQSLPRSAAPLACACALRRP